MDRDNMLSELTNYTQEEYRFSCEIKKFSLFTGVSGAFSLYYIIFDLYSNLGLMVVFTLVTGGLIFHTLQLIDKKATVLNKLNYLCNQLYGKSYANSKIEVNNDIVAFLTKK